MVRGVVAVMAIAAVALVAFGEALPMARTRIRTHAKQALQAKGKSTSWQRALAAAGASMQALTCTGAFVDGGDLVQDAYFNAYCNGAAKCDDKDKILTYKPEQGQKGGNVGQGYCLKVLQEMIGWAGEHVQWSFKSILNLFVKAEKAAGREARAIVATPKSSESAMRKVGNPKEYNWNPLRLVDGIRGSFVYSTAADMEVGVCEFRKWIEKNFGKGKDRDCSIVKDKDRWTHPLDTGYADFMLTLQCKWGNPTHYFKTEIQFHVCSVMMAKQGDERSIALMINGKDLKATDVGYFAVAQNGHKIYESQRVLDADKQKADIAALTVKSQALYAKALTAGAMSRCDISNAPKFAFTYRDEQEEAHADNENDFEDVTESGANKKWVNVENIHAK